MNCKNIRNPFTLFAMLLALVACGGGGGGGGTTASGGTGGTGISFGSVTGFGSIIVNGDHLDDTTASVTLDDNPGVGSHGGLKQGMVVKVSGTFNGNTGTASTIEFRDNLEGPVCDAPPSIDGIRTLRVLGQTVILDATTIVDNNATINFGDIVEVSGLPDLQERIHASFIEKKLPGGIVEVKGRVITVGPGLTFTINNLTVDFLGAMPAVGQFVEVKGTVFACGGPTDVLTATKVELEPEGAGVIPLDVRAEIEGFVTADLNAGSFMIGNKVVAITGSTRFLPEDFGTGDLLVGAKVEADGTFANGVLTATKISFRQNVKLQSNVTNISGTLPTLSFELVGLPGIIITTNSATRFDVPIAGQIRVRGIEGPIDGLNNTVLATRIEAPSGNASDAFLQGAVDDVANPNITILGITVDTSGFSDTPLINSDFEDANDQGISRSTFFGLVQPGTLVKVKGNLSGVSISWDEAELED